jgi:spermidine/putrescine transport system ATP-binding protein
MAEATGGTSMVELRRVTKRFGEFVAVEDVSLDIQRGEFLTLLGPSGCGKTTLLRMISGFEIPSEGHVWLDGNDVTNEPPYRRNVNQVFQSYALFPHLNVAENIAFGLKMKGASKSTIAAKVREGIELVSLQGKEHNKPSALSGGQRQRVALARAIVCEPKVLLLDEPLSALDAKLRHQMQSELKQLQKRLGITFVFVTHDQEEALTMSDRIAIVNKGRIEQLGSVDEIYHRPKTRFVAEFIGQANLMPAQVIARENDDAIVRLADDITLRVDGANLPPSTLTVLVSFRPEKIHLTKHPAPGENHFPAEVMDEVFRGQTDQMTIRTSSGLEFTVVVANESRTQECFHKGDRLFCCLHPEDIVVVQEG